MASRRRIRRMRRQGLTCRDVGRECDMQVERSMFHHGLDGRVFRVRRFACAVCGRQLLVAKRETFAASEPDGVEIYDERDLYRDC